MLVSRPPCPALAPFVKSLWFFERAAPAHGITRELMVPTGLMQLVFRFSTPLRVFADETDRDGRTFGPVLVGGVRASAYLRDLSQPEQSVGAQLRPGMGAALLGAPADELALRHTRLDDLWERQAEWAHERLAEAADPAHKLNVLEAILIERLARAAPIPPPGLLAALRLIEAGARIADAAALSGFSHRHFAARFENAVGLPPKLYARVRRLTRALAGLKRAQPPSWSALALAHGFSDQAHFTRELRALGGVTPGDYLRARPEYANHVALADQVNFLQDAVHRRGVSPMRRADEQQSTAQSSRAATRRGSLLPDGSHQRRVQGRRG